MKEQEKTCMREKVNLLLVADGSTNTKQIQIFKHNKKFTGAGNLGFCCDSDSIPKLFTIPDLNQARYVKKLATPRLIDVFKFVFAF